MTLIILLLWALTGSHPVARITADHFHISLTGWGTVFLICLLCDAYAAARSN